ncbi:FAST kinase domain-containing protein 5, mitochondrial [Antennarius striatus]|uniref:FAST kinase domain-containing protein 5, mitochondrial n=1 Tax=Antennarius striatus TaxID=241820 RepID=UPI0035B47056
MAVCVLCRRVPRLHHFLRKDSTLTQVLRVIVQDTDDVKRTKGELQQWEPFLPAQYRPYYNPSSYYSVCHFTSSCNQAENDEDVCLSTLTPSLWQQGNHYIVSCSRYLSTSSNRLLELPFNKDSEPPLPSDSLINGNLIPQNVKVDSRAFQRCRREYASITLDLKQLPHPVEWHKVVPLLEKVDLFKDKKKPSVISQLFVELSHLQPNMMSLLRFDQRFIRLLQYSVEHLGLFTNHQVLRVLRSLVWLDLPSDHGVFGLYEAELCCRVDHMSLHQLLLAADLCRCIGMQVPQFLQSLYPAIRLYLGKMNVSELVQLLYIMGEGRWCPEDLRGPVEDLLMNHLDKLYPEEVGTVCLGLFKSQTPISDHAVTCIVQKACSYVGDMSDFAIANILKYMRFSHVYHEMWLENMAQEVPRRAPGMGIKGLMHVALACSSLHFKNDQILLAIAERVPFLAQQCRSKDSSKMLWAFGTLGFLPVQNPSFYPSLIEALRQRKVEFQKYPQHLLSGLLGLIFVSQFPEDLIALALNPDFVRVALKSSHLDLRKDYLTLDEAVALELPQWTGPRLSCKLREEVAEKLWIYAKSDVCLKPEVREAESLLQDLLGGEEFVCKRMILPHTRTIDLEVHLDASGQPIPVNPASNTDIKSLQERPSKVHFRQEWNGMNVGVTLTDELFARLTTRNATKTFSSPVQHAHVPTLDPDEGGSQIKTRLSHSNEKETVTRSICLDSAHQDSKSPVKLAIQVSNRNHYLYHSQQLLGLHSMKRRHLKLAGYRVVELCYWEWFPLLRESKMKKLEYLHRKIYDSLH